MTFRRSQGWTDKPVDIPCGECFGCQKIRKNQWALRIVHELEQHDANCFLTLTIDDDHMPDNRSLDIRHWQLFAKRLREAAGPFRFFMSGEYGERYDRPHYHAAMFGLDMRVGAEPFENTSGEDTLYRSGYLDKLWGMGHVAIGEMTYASAQYIAKYLVKSTSREDEERRLNGRKPEFINMSRRPGIGADWIKKYKEDAFGKGMIVHDGKKHKVPAFYERFLTEGELAVWQRKKMKIVEGLVRSGELERNRLDTKERILEIQHERYKRTKAPHENF